MKSRLRVFCFALIVCSSSAEPNVRIVQTSKAGDRLTEKAPAELRGEVDGELKVDRTQRHQTIIGFGASFTESSAWNLATLGEKKRQEVLTNLFDPEVGVGFSLTRTHINSSDYSLGHYSYVDAGDLSLASFSIEEDLKGFSGDENEEVLGIDLGNPQFDLIPMIQAAREVSGASFEILASPWSPPSWMKEGEHKEMTGGRLRRDEDAGGRRIYWDAWARYIVRYLESYGDEGIKIWGITPQNEPGHAKDASWDTCYWSAQDELEFVRDYLGPELSKAGFIDRENLEESLKLFIFDHNKADLLDFATPILSDSEAASYVYGTAFHWYSINLTGETNYRGDDLDELQSRFPDKALLHSESSIDIHADAPIDQYWDPENSDWTGGKFVPFSQYAIDVITDLNNGSIGYIDWCMVLSTTGGPNPYNNFNSASVLVDPVRKTVSYTPLYYLLGHFSKYVRPGATRLELSAQMPADIHATAMENVDGSIVVILYNSASGPVNIRVEAGGEIVSTTISGEAIQTILF